MQIIRFGSNAPGPGAGERTVVLTVSSAAWVQAWTPTFPEWLVEFQDQTFELDRDGGGAVGENGRTHAWKPDSGLDEVWEKLGDERADVCWRYSASLAVWWDEIVDTAYVQREIYEIVADREIYKERTYGRVVDVVLDRSDLLIVLG